MSTVSRRENDQVRLGVISISYGEYSHWGPWDAHVDKIWTNSSQKEVRIKGTADTVINELYSY